MYCLEVINNVKFMDRFIGLMFKKNYTRPYLFRNCTRIHTCFMRKPLHIIYLDNNEAVLHIEYNLKPWKLGLKVVETKHIVECDAKEPISCSVGTKLSLTVVDKDYHQG